jgi:biotin-dependent carboxylase-like uncharacterized protein
MSTEAIFEILAPGLQTAVQDPGRTGYGRFGVATSGALDSFALRTGNLLVGNPEKAACLETMLLGLRIRALQDIIVAVTGADLQPYCDGEPFPMWQSGVLRKGQELSLKGPRSGFRTYLAVGGGIHVPDIMGSKATNLSACFGGLDGRGLQPKDVVSGNHPTAYLANTGRRLAHEDIPVYPEKWTLRVILGPQADHFSMRGQNTFLASTYTVSPQSDRTGIRLSGDGIDSRPDVTGSIISEGVVPGAIQVPGDGQPIIILNETVTGGYRKIAIVVGADLPCLGQIKPGDRINFEAVSLEVADRALRLLEDKILRLKRFLEP